MNQTIVGKLNKAFGIKGYIKVIPEKPFIADLKSSEIWFIKRGKEVIPYFVESIENEPHFLIKFEDIDSPESAKTITGCPILLRHKDISIQSNAVENDLDKLLNFNVWIEDEKIGKVVRIEEFPQQLMAFIAGEDIEFMMPLTPFFIQNIDVDDKRISVSLPDGFIDSQS